MTIIKTTTRTVKIEMLTAAGVDWSADYIGNQSDTNLTRVTDGSADYSASDETADWWVRQCARQVEADEALAELSDADREAVLAEVGSVEFSDQPDAVLAAIAAREEGETDGVEVELDSAAGPRMLVTGDVDNEQVEAALPAGWTVGDNWGSGVTTSSGAISYPLVQEAE